jgi:hypothetical protein
MYRGRRPSQSAPGLILLPEPSFTQEGDMSLSKNLSIRRKAASANSTRSAYLRKQIEFELSAYCRSEAWGFSSWYELDNWLATKDKNNVSSKGN